MEMSERVQKVAGLVWRQGIDAKPEMWFAEYRPGETRTWYLRVSLEFPDGSGRWEAEASAPGAATRHGVMARTFEGAAERIKEKVERAEGLTSRPAPEADGTASVLRFLDEFAAVLEEEQSGERAGDVKRVMTLIEARYGRHPIPPRASDRPDIVWAVGMVEAMLDEMRSTVGDADEAARLAELRSVLAEKCGEMVAIDVKSSGWGPGREWELDRSFDLVLSSLMDAARRAEARKTEEGMQLGRRLRELRPVLLSLRSFEVSAARGEDREDVLDTIAGNLPGGLYNGQDGAENREAMNAQGAMIGDLVRKLTRKDEQIEKLVDLLVKRS